MGSTAPPRGGALLTLLLLWSADLIDKSSINKCNKNYKFILTVIDIFTKYAWAIPLKDKSDLSITNGFKIVLSQSRKSEKL